jgi:hypothetical protein
MSLNLRREEIYFRNIYRDLLEHKKITIVFRPGNRLNGHPKGFHLGETVTLRIIEEIGADWAHLAPKLDSKFALKAEITSLEAKKLSELKKRDFEGSSPDVQDVDALRYHLGIIYNLSPKELDPDAIVTKTSFKYI